MTIRHLEDGVEAWVWFFQPRSKLLLPLYHHPDHDHHDVDVDVDDDDDDDDDEDGLDDGVGHQASVPPLT